MTPSSIGETYTTEQEEARRLGLSSRTLQTWRYKGSGPPYFKFGSAVRYNPKLTDEWIASRARSNTSQTNEDGR